ncbi:22273_t:CDS:2, partial [Racocetra persica]
KHAEDGDSKEQFDPVEKNLEKANEKWKKKVRVFLGEPGMIFAVATSAQKRLLRELVTPYYYITALR